jgi:predicted nucleotidyltransferase
MRKMPVIGTDATAAAVQNALEEIVEQLIQNYRPQQIILFGSLAAGEAREDSDIDLLIIKETSETPLARRVHVRRIVSQAERRVPFSPLVLTPQELAQRLALGDPFYQDIIQRGKVLYVRNGIADPGRLVRAR